MDEHTKEAVESVADTARIVAGELNSLADHLKAIVDSAPDSPVEPSPVDPGPIPPPVVPGPGDGQTGPDPLILLAPIPGVMGLDPGEPDRAKISRLFGIPEGTDRFWADPSTSLRVYGDGSFRVIFDAGRMGEGGKNTGGSSWVNAALPLPRVVEAAEISYVVEFDPDGRYGWDWGESGKLPGLQRWVEGISPGGGEVTRRNWSVRPCWNDWNRDGKAIRFGPYVYGQEASHRADEIYAPDYPLGTLRWIAPVLEGLEPVALKGRPVRFTTRVGPDPAIGSSGRASRVATTVEISGRAQQTSVYSFRTTEAGPHEVTSVPFVFMYGGDARKYGPVQPVTELHVSEFVVREIA